MSDGNASTHVARTATLNLAWEFLLRTGARFITEKLLFIQTDAALFHSSFLRRDSGLERKVTENYTKWEKHFELILKINICNAHIMYK